MEELIRSRKEKLHALEEKGINPFPSRIELKGQKLEIAKARESSAKEVLVCGRLWSIRSHGAMVFADLKDESGKIQLLFSKNILSDNFPVSANGGQEPTSGWEVAGLLDSGDFLAAKGKVFQTKAGETTVEVREFQILAKSLRPLPSEWYGLKDVEERFRKRYLDLLLNPEIRKRFDVRTKLVAGVRQYLDSLGYFEVETPTLQPLYGGANAKPFKTHLNALDIDVYLRIADELYLKRLIVGGYEKVYEICKDFRNEGMDQTHNPEFTMIEFYQAYSDYHGIMEVAENLLKHLASSVFGDTRMKVGEHEVDIGKQWPKIKMTEAIKEKLSLDVEKETEKSLIDFCRKNKIELVGGETKGQLIFSIFEHKVTESLIQPTWIIDYPKDVSPLSKNKPGEPDWVERFEGYIGGKEIFDGWSELTDPREQRQRFESDKKVVRKDKEEAQQVDEDFLEAMEYGMPPIGGIGIGIDRLAMFFTNTWNIRELIIFPAMRPKE